MEESLKGILKDFKSYSIQDREIFHEKAKKIANTYNDGVYE